MTIYILPSVIYTSQSTDVNISAAFFAANGSTTTITWFFNGLQINTTSSARYSTIQIQTSEILQVANVAEDILGNYTVVISHEGASQSDTVTIAYPGMFLTHKLIYYT